MNGVLIELLIIHVVIIKGSKLGAERARTIDVKVTSIGATASSHVFDRITHVWLVTFRRSPD